MRMRAAVVLAWGCATAWGLPAFPGAEGFGSDTPGGRGGRVIEVTSLEDSGPGTLREAVTARGPRTVVFRVGGTIRLKSHLRVTEPFITIAGQTAPGDGILLRDAGFYIQTHDVVVRFIRSRVGPSLAEKYSTQDAMQISGEDPHHIVVDHCSFSWSVDECVGIRVPSHDITFSWNIVSEAQKQPFGKEQIGEDRSHSMSLILSGGPTRCSLHHNLLALCNSRNPRIQGGRHGFINNVVYGWGWLTGTFSRNPEVNFIGNYYKPGPGSKALKAICEKPDEMGTIYVKGNRSPDRPNDSLPEWELTVSAPAAGHQAAEPFDMPHVITTTAEVACDAVLAGAGAVLPVRDPVDRRVVRCVRLEMGEKIDRPDQVGGYPEMSSGSAPKDSDHDGMPDDWELAQGFDPLGERDGAADADGDGYTNLEEYLEYLVREGMLARPEVRGISIDRPGGPFTLECGGTRLPVVRVGGDRRSYYTHAFFREGLSLKVSSAARGGALSVEPPRFRDGLKHVGDGVEFRVVEEGARIVDQGPEGNRLLVFFDTPPNDAPLWEGDKVIDARRFGISAGRANITDKLQAALDEAGKSPGSVVFVPDGQNEIDSVRIPSHVTVYLAVSSVLYASGRPVEAMFLIDRVEDVRLMGPGVIDGRGDEDLPAVAAVRVRNSASIRLEDLLVRNPSGSGIELANSHDVNIHRAKVLAVGDRRGAGGLRIDGCESVACVRCFISCAGTGIMIESAGREVAARPTRAVSIIETTVLATDAGIAIGPNTQEPVENVLVRDGDLMGVGRGIVVEAGRGAGSIRELVFRDLTLSLRSGSGGSDIGRPFLVSNDSGAQVKDLLFDRIRANAFDSSRVRGSAASPIEDVRFWGIDLAAEKTCKGEPRPLFDLRDVRRPELRFLHVTWPPDKSACWTEILRAENAEALRAPPDETFQKSQ